MSDSDEKSEDNGTKVPYNLKNLVDSDSEVEEGRYNDEIEVTKKSRRILSSSEESENEQTETVKVHRRKNKNPKKKNLDEKKTRVSLKYSHMKFLL
jgi:Arc/MetJ-type ribon-helix-helix transcriptional regulator